MNRRLALGLTALMLAGCASTEGLQQAVTPTAGPMSDRVVLAGMSFEPQIGWTVATTTSSARVAEYRLPGVASDDATLVVYYFGNRGAANIQGNLDRWYGQFEQLDGTPSSDAATVQEREIDGLELTSVDLAGTYVAETAPGSGTRVNEPGWRLLAAVVTTAAGPYYAKLVGPAETVARWKPSWQEFLNSLQPGAASETAPPGAEHPLPSS